MTKSPKRLTYALYIRNFIFGIEDSLVSTVGLLSGIAAAQVDKQTIFLTGTILIFVEAFSMGVGSFLSENFAEEYAKKNDHLKNTQSKIAAFIMFFSYFAAGFIPLYPYIIFPTNIAFYISIISSLIALFLLGFVGATIFKINTLKNGLRMLLMGGVAIISGIIVGLFVHSS